MTKLLLLAIVAAYLLHRAAVAAEERGWIYYRKRRGSSGALGDAFLEVQSMIEPSKRIVLEERRREAKEEDDEGDPPSAPDGYRITTDPAAVDLDAVHAFLSTTYWAEGIPKETLARAIAGSIPFSVLHGEAQVGFARVVTDRATFAYLADVYVLEDHRGRGLGRRLVEAVLAWPELRGIRRFVLVTRDAHALYAGLGFAPLRAPDGYMEIHRPSIYRGEDGRP